MHQGATCLVIRDHTWDKLSGMLMLGAR
jgi:hypothetical protein